MKILRLLRVPLRLLSPRLRLLLGALFLVGAAFVTFANLHIVHANRDRLYTNIDQVPARDVGLVLGANRVTGDGRPNLHFVYRMDAAAALYHAGKIRHVLVSGDNGRRDYDEPAMMRAALISRGVPREAITCDYAGFRTLDSVIRAHDVFGLDACTIITQRYHNTRALEVARATGLDAVGFCTRDVALRHSTRTELREIASRTLAILDLYVWHKQPRFPGPREPIALVDP